MAEENQVMKELKEPQQVTMKDPKKSRSWEEAGCNQS